MSMSLTAFGYLFINALAIEFATVVLTMPPRLLNVIKYFCIISSIPRRVVVYQSAESTLITFVMVGVAPL